MRIKIARKWDGKYWAVVFSTKIDSDVYTSGFYWIWPSNFKEMMRNSINDFIESVNKKDYRVVQRKPDIGN